MRKRDRIAEASQELQALQRQRASYIKSRIMISNRLLATIADTLGYSSGLTEAERRKLVGEADKIIKQVDKGEITTEMDPLIKVTLLSMKGFKDMQKQLEKEMIPVAKTLKVADWVGHPDQRGFGILFLGIVIGETGDLKNYDNPAKVWKRLGCAPYTKKEETLMGSTWKRRTNQPRVTKLTAKDWEAFGYSPRRRSISYLIGEGLLKQNKSIYRKRYDVKKAELQELHPDYKPIRCHLHGMLLASKLLLKNLWLEWNEYPSMPKQNW